MLPKGLRGLLPASNVTESITIAPNHSAQRNGVRVRVMSLIGQSNGDSVTGIQLERIFGRCLRKPQIARSIRVAGSIPRVV